MQVSRSEGEPSKWLAQSRNYSTIEALATELLLEIFKHLGWEDVLMTRRTCKLFFDISTSRPLWVCLFSRLSGELRVPPILERPISAYTSAELEYVVMRRISSEVRWTRGYPALPRVRTHPVPYCRWPWLPWCLEQGDDVILLEGGRWLLMSLHRDPGYIYAYDLDVPLHWHQARTIIEFETGDRAEPMWRIAAYLDRDARPELAFKLCLTLRTKTTRPPDSDWPLDEIHIYDLIVKGRGSEAFLEARKIKSLLGDMGTDIGDLFLQGNYLVRLIEPWDKSLCLYEVCNWFLSNSAIHFKSYIEVMDMDNDNDLFVSVFPLPDGKLVRFSTHEIALYDITKLKRHPTGQINKLWGLRPYWKLGNLNLSEKPHYTQLPSFDSHATRLTVIMDGVIHGFTIPYDTDKSPQLQPISDCKVSNAWSLRPSISKLYAEIPNKGGIRTLELVWPGDKDATGDMSSLLPAVTQSTHREYSMPYNWDDIPCFDESSNRIFTFTDTHWVILDFAYI